MPQFCFRSWTHWRCRQLLRRHWSKLVRLQESIALPHDLDLVAAQRDVTARRAAREMHLFRARAAEAFLESLPRRRRLSMSASAAQHSSTQGVAVRERPEGEMVRQSITVSHGLASTSPGSECRLDVPAAQDLLLRVATAGLCGKLFFSATPELVALCESMDAILQARVQDPPLVCRGCFFEVFADREECGGWLSGSWNT